MSLRRGSQGVEGPDGLRPGRPFAKVRCEPPRANGRRRGAGGPVGRAALALAAAVTAGLAQPRVASAEVPIRHEVTLGLAGVYDGGYDRGVRYGAGYELSVSMLRVRLALAAGDTDPRREQHWSVALGVVPLDVLRLEAAFHHRTFTTTRFGDNMVTLRAGLDWRGLLLDVGLALRFPITRPELIQSPVELDLTLFDAFMLFRLGYLWDVGQGVRLGLEAANLSRFEIRNFSYPTFAVVAEWRHPGGVLRGEVGLGTAGFWAQGATIDRGFIRLEYSRAIP